MANGNTIAEIRAILGDKQKVSQGVVNRLQLSLTAEIYEKLESAAADEKKHREAIEVRLVELERRSVGMWVWRHPKAATAMFLSLYTFAISDIRDPFLAMLADALKLIF
jgi:hypothetical protein